MPALEQNLTLKIGEVAREFDIAVEAIRMYEREGLLLTYKPKSGQCLFSAADVHWISCTRRLITARAINIPVQKLEQRWRELEKHRTREILIYCRAGNRSTRAAKILRDKNFKVIHMAGGMLQWNALSPPPAQKQE